MDPAEIRASSLRAADPQAKGRPAQDAEHTCGAGAG